MPALSGAETFRALRAMQPGLPVIIVTGYPDSDLMAQALAVEPFTLMPKPVSLKALQQTVTVLVAHSHRSREARTPATVRKKDGRIAAAERLVIVLRGHGARCTIGCATTLEPRLDRSPELKSSRIRGSSSATRMET